MSLKNRLMHKLRNRNVSIFLITCILLLLIIGGVRSCLNYPQNKLYQIGFDTTWYPSQLHGKDRNMAVFAAELLFSIGREIGVRFELKPVESGNLFSGLEKGTFDGIFAYLTSSIKQKYLYSNPFFSLGPVLVVPIESSIKKLQDLDGKVVGVSAGTSLIFDLDKYPSLLFNNYGDILTALVDLDHNVIDGVFLDTLPAHIYTKGFFSGKLKVVTAPSPSSGLCLIAPMTDEGQVLIDLFNSGLEKIKSKGIYDALLEKWDLINPTLID